MHCISRIHTLLFLEALLHHCCFAAGAVNQTDDAVQTTINIADNLSSSADVSSSLCATSTIISNSTSQSHGSSITTSLLLSSTFSFVPSPTITISASEGEQVSKVGSGQTLVADSTSCRVTIGVTSRVSATTIPLTTIVSAVTSPSYPATWTNAESTGRSRMTTSPRISELPTTLAALSILSDALTTFSEGMSSSATALLGASSLPAYTSQRTSSSSHAWSTSATSTNSKLASSRKATSATAKSDSTTASSVLTHETITLTQFVTLPAVVAATSLEGSSSASSGNNKPTHTGPSTSGAHCSGKCNLRVVMPFLVLILIRAYV